MRTVDEQILGERVDSPHNAVQTESLYMGCQA